VDLGRVLKDIEERHSGAFAELGFRVLQHFKYLIDRVDAFLDLLADSGADFRVKLVYYAEEQGRCFESCRYCAKWLGSPFIEGLKAEIYELLEQIIDWWSRQNAYVPTPKLPCPSALSLTTPLRGVKADPVVLKSTSIKQVCGAENSAYLFPSIYFRKLSLHKID